MAENDQTPGEQRPKIIVDDDWKAQARAEKEKLARELEQQKQAAAAGAASGGVAVGAAQAQPAGPGTAAAQAGAPTREAAAAKAAQERHLPAASFASHVNSLVAQVFMALGGMEDPRTKRRYVDLDLAKYHIDTLAVLEQKTKGNLTEDEKRLLDQGLYECRMQYVHVAQSVVEMTAPGAEFEQ
jgi:hypothetical protein